MSQPTLYEWPLNERMRNFMRLENCFAQIDHFGRLGSIWDCQTSLFVLIDILTIIDRFDIRTEIVKELDRNIASFSNLLDLPSVDTNRLRLTLDELQTQLYALHNIDGKIGDKLRTNDLINNVRQRLSNTSSINSFEIPSFYYWLNQAPESKKDQIYQWLAMLKPIEDGVLLLNRLLRDSTVFETQPAENGFYQQTLNQQQACQMVRIALPTDVQYFPEISGSKHRISVRFMQYLSSDKRPAQVEGSLEFDMSCCSI